MEEKIREAILEPLEKEGIKLLSVEFGMEDNVETLFVTIDSNSGVDTNLCEKAIKIINPIIDDLDLDLENYVLDVCSKESEE